MMIKASSTPFNSSDYEFKIKQTVPNYDEFHSQIINITKNAGFAGEVDWLDIGCGTGELAVKAAKEIKDIHFCLAEKDEKMLSATRERTADINAEYLLCTSEAIDFEDSFDTVSAVLVHHYLKYNERKRATQNIYRALKKGGIYFCVENITFEQQSKVNEELDRWCEYQLKMGKSEGEVNEHRLRFGKNYFPITENEHISLLKECNFKNIEIFKRSYMQLGIYAVK